MGLHTSLIEVIHLLKYSAVKEGVCQGVTLRWIEACLLNEEAVFAARLKKIASYGAQLPSLIDKLKEEKKSLVTPAKLELWDILAFLESLVIYHSPMDYTHLFAKGDVLSQESVNATSQLAACDKIKSQGGLRILCEQPIIYTQEELIAYLDDLKEIIGSSSNNGSFGIKIESINHAMALSYYKEKGWRFMDINQYSPDDIAPVSTKKAVELMAPYFRKSTEANNSYFAGHTSIISTNNSLEETQASPLISKLELLRSQHLLTSEFAAREAANVSLVYLAARIGDSRLISQLINLGANVNLAADNNGATPAYIAAQNGHVLVLAELAKHGADLNKATNDGATPALIAAQNGHVLVLAELAKHGTDLNKPTNDGATPALIAAKKGHALALAELAKHGVDLNKAMNGTTLALLAAQNGHALVLAELAKHGIDLNKAILALLAAANGHVFVLAELAKHGVDLNKAINNGTTPALIAAQNGHALVLAELAKHGVDFNKAANNGVTPVFIAAQTGHVLALAELAKHGADLNKTNNDGVTPAFIAAQNGHALVIAELAKHGADLNKAINNGITPALIAAAKGHVLVIAELAKHGADLNKAMNNSATPALIAAQNGHALVIAELAKHGADLSKASIDGRTPAFIAAENGHTVALAELEKHGADLNKANNHGVTPAFVAAQNGLTAVISLLIIHGAKLTIPLPISVENLRRDLGSESQEVIARMEKFIKQHVTLKSDTISITPLNISQLMGHKETAKLLSAHHLKELGNKLKPLDIQLDMLQHKACEFQHKREQAQNIIEKEAIFNAAYSQAQSLFEILTTLKKQYQYNEIPYPNFKRQSLDAIASAGKELNKHRGWMEILVNIALCIVAIAPIFKFLLTHSFFHFKTKSAVILEGLEKTINDHQDIFSPEVVF